MKLYQRIATYGLMTTLGLGIIGCNQSSNQQEPVEPRYISGTIKSEKFNKNLIDSDRYFFTLLTEDGFKMFECYGDWSAQKMDGLLDPKDRVKFKIPQYQRNNEDDFLVDLEDIVEINGESFSY